MGGGGTPTPIALGGGYPHTWGGGTPIPWRGGGRSGGEVPHPHSIGVKLMMDL